jgi:hypothetical protein
MSREAQLRSLYEAFNTREVDACLAGMTPDVDWANGWEGGRVSAATLSGTIGSVSGL